MTCWLEASLPRKWVAGIHLKKVKEGCPIKAVGHDGLGDGLPIQNVGSDARGYSGYTLFDERD